MSRMFIRNIEKDLPKPETIFDIKKGQVWALPYTNTITPITRLVKVHWVEIDRDLIHYFYPEEHGVRRPMTKPLSSFLKIAQSKWSKLVEDVQ